MPQSKERGSVICRIPFVLPQVEWVVAVNPKGILTQNQGCACRAVAKRRREARTTLGNTSEMGSNPNGVENVVLVRSLNPVGVGRFGTAFPG